MPRTLSGLRTGEFDSLEVSGQMIHSGEDAAQIRRLKVGDGPDEPTDSTVLMVDGDIQCTGILSSDGSLFDKPLTFSRTSGTDWTEDINYDGGTAVTVKIPTPPDSPRLLTITQGVSILGTYNTTAISTIDIPEPEEPDSPRLLTITQGVSTLGTYNTTATSTIDIPEPEEPDSPHTLTVQQGAAPAMNTYDSTADVTITIPKIYHDVLGGGSSSSASIGYSAALVSSGFGVSLASLPTNSKVLVDVQMYLENQDSYQTHAFYVNLTQSKTSATYTHDREFVASVPSNKATLVRYSKVLTLSGSVDIGLAMDLTGYPYPGVTVAAYWGANYPDLLMTATVI
eukprot:COSAG04_NODE_533_length_12959_cov_8.218497_15_plen_341_part_00